jgi:peptidyl-prolyl cis-trans isomerase D
MPAVPARPDCKRNPMIQFFRNIIFSKIGAGVTIAFLVLIALAFASGDILNFGGSSSIQSSDEVAQAGPHKVTAAEFEKAMTNALESEKENNPQLTMKAFIAGGGTELVLRQLLDRNAIVAFGDKHGIVAGDRLIDSEIAKIPGAQGADGRFNQKNYEQFIQERRLTDKSIRSDLAANLVARQVLLSAGYGAAFSQEATLRYAALLREHRKGAIAYLPSESFAPKTPPSDAEIAAFYDKTRSNYLLPERRVIRYATFDAAVVKTVAAPTEAEIAARYAANRAQYTASETRKIVQLILPTEAAARTVLAETAKGVSLEQAAKSKGLVVAASSVAKPALASQTSPAVADAAYAARTGIVVGPAKSGLGWHLLRVDGIDSKPARTLDQARAELTTAIAEAKRRQALSDFSAKIEEQFDSGSALSDVTKQFRVRRPCPPILLAWFRSPSRWTARTSPSSPRSNPARSSWCLTSPRSPPPRLLRSRRSRPA